MTSIRKKATDTDAATINEESIEKHNERMAAKAAEARTPKLKTLTDALITTRHRSHGSYKDTARASQRLKNVINGELDLRNARGSDMLSGQQLESLDMICTKIGRIIAGDASFHDHWDDIAGYARLCGTREEGKEE